MRSHVIKITNGATKIQINKGCSSWYALVKVIECENVVGRLQVEVELCAVVWSSVVCWVRCGVLYLYVVWCGVGMVESVIVFCVHQE